MLLQPKTLAQHFVHGLLDRVALVACDGFDLRPRRAQPGFERIGRVEHLTDDLLAPSAAVAPQAVSEGGYGHDDGQQGEDESHESGPDGGAASLTRSPGAGKFPARQGLAALTGQPRGPNIPRLMSAHAPESRVPEVLDAWRMVAARRGFEGSLPLTSLPRLRDALCEPEGQVGFHIDFDRDSLGVAYAELRIAAELPLQCQRSLQRFMQPVEVVQRLGLIRDEDEEAALPPGYEPLLVPEDGMLRPAELVEDELILALPVVPLAPGSERIDQEWSPSEDEAAKVNPFAALAGLKKQE